MSSPLYNWIVVTALFVQALYFMSVSPTKRLRKRWRAYREGVTEPEFSGLLAKLEEKDAEISTLNVELDSLREHEGENLEEMEKLNRKLAEVEKERNRIAQLLKSSVDPEYYLEWNVEQDPIMSIPVVRGVIIKVHSKLGIFKICFG